jgi:ABC-type transport system involved in cytochrome bd biosynthesis fused ATPase/permease subunit
LRRSHLVGTDSDDKHDNHKDKFTLDMEIEEEGNNLSVGREWSPTVVFQTNVISLERSLVSLARALLRDEAKVVILDEATVCAIDPSMSCLLTRDVGSRGP